MHRLEKAIYLITFFSFILGYPLIAEEDEQEFFISSQTPYERFTGKIMRPRVRLRAQPNLEGSIIKELQEGDFVIVTGEEENFYAIVPSKDIKGYVYRTYVLDDVIEGDHVNVRLEPSLDSIIIDQLKQGDRIKGKVSTQNYRWLEIELPNTTRFYIAKDFVKNIGPENLISENEEASEDNDEMLDRQMFDNEQIPETDQEIEEEQDEVSPMDEPPSENLKRPHLVFSQNKLPSKMSYWIPKEKEFYSEWLNRNPNKTIQDYYSSEMEVARILRGIIEPYTRNVRNKPGDYILVNKGTNFIIAYLYSTIVNLNEFIGEEVTLKVLERPNNQFAFPSFFVLTTDID